MMNDNISLRGDFMIYGNIDGIKKSALEELERLYKSKCPKDEVCSLEIIETISRVSSFIEREVSVAIDRRGNIRSIAIGDSTSVEIETPDCPAYYALFPLFPLIFVLCFSKIGFKEIFSFLQEYLLQDT